MRISDWSSDVALPISSREQKFEIGRRLARDHFRRSRDGLLRAAKKVQLQRPQSEAVPTGRERLIHITGDGHFRDFTGQDTCPLTNTVFGGRTLRRPTPVPFIDRL